MKYLTSLLLAFFVFGCSAESHYEADDSSRLNQSPTASAWTSAGVSGSGLKVFDVRELEVVDGDERIQFGKLISRLVDLEKSQNSNVKTKAVLQVIETLPTGNVCGSCINKGKEIIRAIESSVHATDTLYIMVISHRLTQQVDYDYVPQPRVMQFVRDRVGSDTKVVGDINSNLQKAFGNFNFPVTLVIDSQYRGSKILNMHTAQPSSVIRALDALPKP